MNTTYSSGVGRKKRKPAYDKEIILEEQMDKAVSLYLSSQKMSLQEIADALSLNTIKVRKLLITAGVYESGIADRVKKTFQKYKETQSYSEAVRATADALGLSKASVTSYLPYEKGVYFSKNENPEKISVVAERQRRYRCLKKLRETPTEEQLWEAVLMYQHITMKTYSGLNFSYEIRRGRSGEYNRELWVDRRENSKAIAWSSVILAFRNIPEVGAVVERPKAFGDIRGVTYIYAMFCRFGVIQMPKKINAIKIT